MDTYEERLAALTPEQRRLLELRLKQQQAAVAAASAHDRPVVQPAPARSLDHRADVAPDGAAPNMQFSLLFFSGDGSTTSQHKYELLTEAARFADQHGFTAVWIPERHFHAFGGLYPNPAVLGAALAMTTQQIKIRAGSVVLPLQHPARVAEEWSVVDNLSKGRVGLSFASGWVPGDFVLATEPYSNRREVLIQGIEAVRKLWSGEPVCFATPAGQQLDVQIYPKPVQPQLPVWLTTSGNPETLVRAGALGANLLTSLLKSGIEQVADDIAIYRQSRATHGYHPAHGHVTLMLHTFIWDQLELVREKVRAPLMNYLSTHLGMYADIARSLGHPINIEHITPQDRETLAAFAFDRYVSSNGLFGTVESCAPLIQRLAAIGVNEIACLIDFGVDADEVIASLHYLNTLRERFSKNVESPSSERIHLHPADEQLP